MRDHGGRHAALQGPEQTAAPMRAQYDHARVVLVGGFDDALPGRRGLHGDAVRPQTRSFGKRCAMRGSAFGRLPDFACFVGIEVRAVGLGEAGSRSAGLVLHG